MATLALIICLALNPLYISLDEDDEAPFAGTLLNDDAIAQIEAKLDEKDKLCLIKIEECQEKAASAQAYMIELIEEPSAPPDYGLPFVLVFGVGLLGGYLIWN